MYDEWKRNQRPWPGCVALNRPHLKHLTLCLLSFPILQRETVEIVVARRVVDSADSSFADNSFGSFSEPMHVQGAMPPPHAVQKQVKLEKGSNGYGLQLETRYSERTDSFFTTITGIIPGTCRCVRKGWLVAWP